MRPSSVTAFWRAQKTSHPPGSFVFEEWDVFLCAPDNMLFYTCVFLPVLLCTHTHVMCYLMGSYFHPLTLSFFIISQQFVNISETLMLTMGSNMDTNAGLRH